MKNKTTRQEWRIRCPFFRYHGNMEIGCEGITDTSVIRLIFPNKEERIQQETIFCAEWFENCELYRAIMEKYEEDDEVTNINEIKRELESTREELQRKTERYNKLKAGYRRNTRQQMEILDRYRKEMAAMIDDIDLLKANLEGLAGEEIG